jgi:hypothetical protein
LYGSLTTVQFLTYEPADFAATGSLSQQAQRGLSQQAQRGDRGQESLRRNAYQKVELHMNAVQDIERRLNIEERWTATHPEYQKTLEYMKNHKFIRVVEKLEGLVVQRLFELSKANLAGTGE